MPGQDVLVCSDSDPCALYTWGWQNPSTGWDTFIEGETEQYALIPNFDPANRWYFVDILHSCDGTTEGCGTRSWYNHTPFVDIDDPASINLQFFPNPATDYVIVKAFDIGTLSLLNLNGQEVKSFNISSHSARLSISDLPSGLYLLRATSRTLGEQSLRLIKE